MNRTPTTVPRHSDTPQPPSTTIRVLRTAAYLARRALTPVSVIFAVLGAFFGAGRITMAALHVAPTGDVAVDVVTPVAIGMLVLGIPGALLALGWLLVGDTIVEAWRASRDPL